MVRKYDGNGIKYVLKVLTPSISGSALIICDVRTMIGKCSVSFQVPDCSGPVNWPIRTEDVRSNGIFKSSVFTPKSSLAFNKICSHTHLASGYPKVSVLCGSTATSGTLTDPERFSVGYLPTTVMVEANSSLFGSITLTSSSGT